jgi:hypothetical protein
MMKIEMVLKVLVFFFFVTVEAHDMAGGPTEFIAKEIISYL